MQDKLQIWREVFTAAGDSTQIRWRYDGEVFYKWWFILRFPSTATLENRSAMPGEDILLRGLYKLRSGNTTYDISKLYGSKESAQSRAFTNSIDFCYANFKQDNLIWWKENLLRVRSAAAIESRVNDSVKGFDFPRKNIVSHFLDCNCLPTSRCGGGPSIFILFIIWH